MICQNCQKRIATVYFSQVINNKKTEMFLCEQCANEKKHISYVSPLSISDFLSGFAGSNASPYISSIPRSMVCEGCGMSYEEFQKTGKLGCGKCYEFFGERLKPVLKRLHGNVDHIGKVPGNISMSLKLTKEIEKLKEELNRAVRNEEYEKAAEIRDKIKAIESGLKTS